LGHVPGTKLWEVTLGNHVFSSPALGPDGTVFVGVASSALGEAYSPNGWLYAISPQGTTNWFVPTYGDIRSSPAIGPDGTIYVGSALGDIYSFSPAGTTNWVFAAGKYPNLYRSFVGSSPAIASDGAVYVNTVGGYEPGVTYPDRLYSFRPDGTTNWALTLSAMSGNQIDSMCFSSPAIGPDGTIYVATRGRRLFAISPAGKTNWVLSLGTQTYSSPAIGRDGTIYFGAEDFKVHAVHPGGIQRWLFGTGSYIESSAAVSFDTIYIGSLDSSFYALDLDGNKRWAVPNLRVSASPALTSDGSIYVVGVTSALLCRLDSTGHTIWTFDLKANELCFSSPVVGADGTVYVGAGKKLFAVSDTNTPASNPWPTFRGDIKHTARAIQRGIQTPSIASDGGFAMVLNVETGRTYHVECSTDLASWSELTNFVSDSPSYQLRDTGVTNFLQRYYRLRTSVPY
jgi:outer membrane protein assembly factor BamB